MKKKMLWSGVWFKVVIVVNVLPSHNLREMEHSTFPLSLLALSVDQLTIQPTDGFFFFFNLMHCSRKALLWKDKSILDG